MAARRMVTILGHSNAEGFAGSSPMLEAAKHLHDIMASRGYPDPDTAGNTPYVQASVYKNIKVWTAKSGFSAPAGTPPAFSPSEGTFLDMNIQAIASPAQAYPYTSPYNYPNTRSLPISPPLYTASTTGGGTRVGAELPLCWQLTEYWAQPVYLNKLAIPASALFRYDQGLPGAAFAAAGGSLDQGVETHFSWLTPQLSWDWSGSTGRFYDVWKARMAGAKAETVAAGDVLDTRLVVMWLGDNDATAASLAGAFSIDRVRYFEREYRALVQKVRQDLEDNGWTQLPGYQVPVVLMGIYNYGSQAVYTAMNAAMQNMERDDPYLRFVATATYQNLDSAGYSDPVIGTGTHISHNGYLQAARDIMDALVDIDTDTSDQLGTEDRITRAQAAERVRIYYERGRSRTDATDEAVNQHLNAAVHHVVNRIGDNAWWLRRILTIALTGNGYEAQTLPRWIARVLRIERPDTPGYPLHFELQGMTDQGRLQIVLKDGASGTYTMHAVMRVRDLVADSQWLPVPHNLTEWVIVETCRRLARASGNIALQASLAAETNELSKDAMRNMTAMVRARNDRLHAQRRLPTRRNMGRWGSNWYWPGGGG